MLENCLRIDVYLIFYVYLNFCLVPITQICSLLFKQAKGAREWLEDTL